MSGNTPRRGLGRGLGSLIPTAPPDPHAPLSTLTTASEGEPLTFTSMVASSNPSVSANHWFFRYHSSSVNIARL